MMWDAHFPNPCPVCGATDEHAAMMQPTITAGISATCCPHPAERGHGTGCMCAGKSKPFALPIPVSHLGGFR